MDVGGNFLDLDALQVLTELPYLILLRAERNIVESAALNPAPFLQVLTNKNFLKVIKTVHLFHYVNNTSYYIHIHTHTQFLEFGEV